VIADNLMPEITATCPPDSTGEVHDSLSMGLGSLITEPLTESELWRACLRHVRLLCSEDQGVVHAMGLLSDHARSGCPLVSSSDWILLHDPEDLAEYARSLFPADRYVYTWVMPGSRQPEE